MRMPSHINLHFILHVLISNNGHCALGELNAARSVLLMPPVLFGIHFGCDERAIRALSVDYG